VTAEIDQDESEARAEAIDVSGAAPVLAVLHEAAMKQD
jgi:hypothetical protein